MDGKTLKLLDTEQTPIPADSFVQSETRPSVQEESVFREQSPGTQI